MVGMPALPHEHARAQGVTILANSHCAHCVHAVDNLTEWALEEGLNVAGVDLWQHPEAAAWFDAEASPLLVFDAPDERVFAGVPTHEEFHRLASGADSAGSGAMGGGGPAPLA